MAVIRWLLALFERIRLALQVFRKGLPKVDRETDRVVAEVIAGQRKPGFDCPQCRTRIVIGITDLLGNGAIQCSHCQLEMKMDWKADPRARQALENLQVAAAKVEQARRFTG